MYRSFRSGYRYLQDVEEVQMFVNSTRLSHREAAETHSFKEEGKRQWWPSSERPFLSAWFRAGAAWAWRLVFRILLTWIHLSAQNHASQLIWAWVSCKTRYVFRHGSSEPGRGKRQLIQSPLCDSHGFIPIKAPIVLEDVSLIEHIN